MNKKILFGNNISNMSKALSKSFKNLGFSVTLCGNRKEELVGHLESGKYDAMVFFSMNNATETEKFLNELRTKFPDTKLYCLFLLDSECEKIKSIKDCACMCFSSNTCENNICFDILCDLEGKENLGFSFEIAEYLVNIKVPCHLKGFRFICLCMEKIISEPKKFCNLSKEIYPFVGEKTGSSTAWIERSIRTMGKKMFKKEIFFDYFPTDSKLENKVLLQALVIGYAKYRKKQNIKKKFSK